MWVCFSTACFACSINFISFAFPLVSVNKVDSPAECGWENQLSGQIENRVDGRSIAKEQLFFTGRRIDAREALSIGKWNQFLGLLTLSNLAKHTQYLTIALWHYSPICKTKLTILGVLFAYTAPLKKRKILSRIFDYFVLLTFGPSFDRAYELWCSCWRGVSKSSSTS